MRDDRDDRYATVAAPPAVVRAVHRSFPTGVTVVTTMAQHAPRGVTVNAFSSVTLDPPSILVAVAKTSTTYASLVGADAFGVNILAGDQSDLAQVFAHSGGEKFANVAWRSGISGVPILDGVCAYVEAEVEQLIHASTHTIFIGRVVAAHSSGRAPLVYLAGAFYDGERLERC